MQNLPVINCKNLEIGGKYVLKEKIGAGSFGQIYKGNHYILLIHERL
jgi:hypothetical protein